MSTKNADFLNVDQAKDKLLKAHFRRPPLQVQPGKPATLQKLAHEQQNKILPDSSKDRGSKAHRTWPWKQAKYCPGNVIKRLQRPVSSYCTELC